jgi:hypothetical protein
VAPIAVVPTGTRSQGRDSAQARPVAADVVGIVAERR